MRPRRGEFVIDVLEFLPRQPTATRVRIETEPILVPCLGKQSFLVEIIRFIEETEFYQLDILHSRKSSSPLLEVTGLCSTELRTNGSVVEGDEQRRILTCSSSNALAKTFLLITDDRHSLDE